MNSIQFEDILKVAIKYGVASFRLQELSVLFQTAPADVPRETIRAAMGEGAGMPTEDQFLFMSGIPLEDNEILAQPPE